MTKITESFVEAVVTQTVNLRLDVSLARELNVFSIDSPAGAGDCAPMPSPEGSKGSGSG